MPIFVGQSVWDWKNSEKSRGTFCLILHNLLNKCSKSTRDSSQVSPVVPPGLSCILTFLIKITRFLKEKMKKKLIFFFQNAIKFKKAMTMCSGSPFSCRFSTKTTTAWLIRWMDIDEDYKDVVGSGNLQAKTSLVRRSLAKSGGNILIQMLKSCRRHCLT